MLPMSPQLKSKSEKQQSNTRSLPEIDTGLQKTPADGMFEEACQFTEIHHATLAHMPTWIK